MFRSLVLVGLVFLLGGCSALGLPVAKPEKAVYTPSSHEAVAIAVKDRAVMVAAAVQAIEAEYLPPQTTFKFVSNGVFGGELSEALKRKGYGLAGAKATGYPVLTYVVDRWGANAYRIGLASGAWRSDRIWRYKQGQLVASGSVLNGKQVSKPVVERVAFKPKPRFKPKPQSLKPLVNPFFKNEARPSVVRVKFSPSTDARMQGSPRMALNTLTKRSDYAVQLMASRNIDALRQEQQKFTGFKTRLYQLPNGMVALRVVLPEKRLAKQAVALFRQDFSDAFIVKARRGDVLS